MTSPPPQSNSSAGQLFLKYRKAWLALIVTLAVGLNLLYIWEKHPGGDSVAGLLRRSVSRSRLESAADNLQPQFLYSNTADDLEGWCHSEPDAEYDGEEVLRWGSEFLVSSPELCCDACRAMPGCNVWVYCNRAEGGCPENRKPQECWLKKKEGLSVVRPQGRRRPNSGWVSGALFSPEDHRLAMIEEAHKKRLADDAFKEELRQLRANESLPLVWLDVSIHQFPPNRVEIVLFPHISPRAAENFRRLCTGELGFVPEGREGAGREYHWKGAQFYRIVDQFIDQAGLQMESALGGAFRDDPGGLALKHDRKGLLSMANAGPHTNTAHFSIMMGPAPHLDGHYTIFGQVVSGLEVVDAINALSVGKPENTAGAEEDALIVDAGQIRPGTIVPDLSRER